MIKFELIESKGGLISKRVTTRTNYLIIDGEINPNWKHESFGRKIEQAMIYKLNGQRISIVSEHEWVKQL